MPDRKPIAAPALATAGPAAGRFDPALRGAARQEETEEDGA